MPIVVRNKTLRGLKVKEVCRKQVVRLHKGESIENGIFFLKKYKVNAILVQDDSGQPAGVVTKTDIMGAYYAALPISSPLEFIMVSPVLYCRIDDMLDTALEQMQLNRIHGLYVKDADGDDVIGILSYADIVGLLYQYCHQCRLSKFNSAKGNTINRIKANEVMSTQVVSYHKDDTLTDIMEALSACRFGGLLVTDGDNLPLGTVSKTDIVTAYGQDIPQDAAASAVMTADVISCSEETVLEDAIYQMVLSEIQRIFVYREDADTISGVLSLSDIPRFRSGSCHACVAARITVDKHP